MRVVFILALFLTLVGCRDEKRSNTASKAASKAAIEARQREQKAQQEKAQQEKKAQRESDERKARLRTIRVLGFIVLSGGAVAVLVLSGRPSAHPVLAPMTPEWRARTSQAPRGRIIETNPPPVRRNNHRRP